MLPRVMLGMDIIDAENNLIAGAGLVNPETLPTEKLVKAEHTSIIREILYDLDYRGEGGSKGSRPACTKGKLLDEMQRIQGDYQFLILEAM
ncbi:hypothetical protein J4217_02525 [Candidatus Pacearchaeota archaeon]|nr:hypothetical protein [Candidatus Pacearchaeota archaeon]